jgi:hypothetical protein
MRIQFGTGQLFLNPNGGNVPTSQTPQILATLQDCAIDIAATIKDLRGQYQFPDDTAISDKKITWKSGSGRFDIDLYNNVFFGEAAINTGGQPQSVQEAHTIPASSTYTVTVTNAADIPLKDLGVQYSSTGQKFTNVGSGSLTAAGQYKVVLSTGVYTFYLADAGVAVLISYGYTLTTGRILTVNQHTQGFGPALELILSMPYQELTTGVPNYVHLYSCKVSKMGMPFKRADYLISDIEGEAYSNAAGQVADFYED